MSNDKECPECQGVGTVPYGEQGRCPTCYGTGRLPSEDDEKEEEDPLKCLVQQS